MILYPPDLTGPERRACRAMAHRRLLLVDRAWRLKGAPAEAVHDRTVAGLLGLKLASHTPATAETPAMLHLTVTGRDMARKLELRILAARALVTPLIAPLRIRPA